MGKLKGAASAAATVFLEELKNALEWAIATEGDEDRIPLLREVKEIVSEPGAFLRLLMEAEGLPSIETVKNLQREHEDLTKEHLLLVESILIDLGINSDPDYGYSVEGDPGERLFPTLRDAVGAKSEIDKAEKNRLNVEIDDLVAELEDTRNQDELAWGDQP